MMAVSQEDLVFLQDALPFWNGLDKHAQEKLAGAVTRRSYRKGELLHQGRECLGVMVLRSGQVRTFLVSQSGKEVTLYRSFERDVCLFSASCVLHNITFEVNIEAEEDTVVLLIPPPLWKELSKTSLAVADYAGELMASQFSEVMWTVEQILFMSFDKRLALFLLEQSSIEGSDTLKITQETIARHMGSAREVVTRMLRYFQGEGMVRLFRGGIELIGRAKLEQIAQG